MFVAPLLFAACGGADDSVFGAVGGTTGSTTGGMGGATGGSGSGSVSSGSSSGGDQGGAGQGGSGSGGSGSGSGGGAAGDNDGDGLDDAWEQKIAEDYMPFLSIDPEDGCPLGGIVFRLRPHPANPKMIHIIYDHLFEEDCGLGGHVGDNEVFGATIDPAVPPPAGILTLVAVTHQGTACEKTTKCGSCGGLDACSTAQKKGADYPVVFSADGKHATYVQKGECSFLSCFDSCAQAPSEPPTPLVNAGEPSKHLIEDLTANGFITAANGWTKMELFNFNPWDPGKDFGTAGNVADDLQDSAFEAPVCP